MAKTKEIKCSQVWRLILDFYQEKGVKDKLKNLKLNRFDHKPPHLKANAAQIRALVPFFENLLQTWTPTESSPEMMAMKAAIHSLHLCCEMLSSKQRQQTLLTESTKFASQLVLWHNKDEDRWACTAKLHLFIELGMEGGSL